MLAGPDVLLRSVAGGPFNALTTYPGDPPLDIALARHDWRRAYVLDAQKHVFATSDAGATWTQITGNLSDPFPFLQAIEVIERPSPLSDAVLVGGQLGVYVTTNPGAGSGATWSVFGTGLPHAPVLDLRYHPAADVLVAGTNGRGAWLMENASVALP